MSLDLFGKGLGSKIPTKMEPSSRSRVPDLNTNSHRYGHQLVVWLHRLQHVATPANSTSLHIKPSEEVTISAIQAFPQYEMLGCLLLTILQDLQQYRIHDASH